MDEEKKDIERETVPELPQQAEPGLLDAKQGAPDTKSGIQAITVPLSIIVAGALIAGAIMYSNGKQAQKQQNLAGAAAPPIQGELKDVSDLKSLEGNGEVLGKPDAPVSVVEFADFQCPFCGRFHAGAGRQIIEQYVKKGKAKFIYRHFAFLGPESGDAAQATECARDQGKFWQYHDYLFEHQNGENQGAFSKDNLKNFAKIIGLHTQDFNSCLDSGRHAAAVEKDTADGRQYAVSGTPTVFINGKPVVGAQPFEAFKTVIEAALAGK